jgi:hypothetical protein
MLGDVSEVIAQYASGAAAVDDPRVTLHEAVLTHTASGSRIEQDIAPGTPITLTLRATANVDLPRCSLQLWVHRSDGLSIFDGVSFTDGMPPHSLSAGEMFEATISVTPNVLKGMYTIGVNLVDPDRLWPNLLLPSVASFVVTDNLRWGGCVELNPVYRLRTPSRAAGARSTSSTVHSIAS